MYQIEITTASSSGSYEARYPHQVGTLITSIAEATPGKVQVEIEYTGNKEEDE